MELRLLGPLEVRLGDRLLDLGPRKQRAVLAMLALKPGRTVAADHLAEGLWGDESPASGAKMVQLYVSHLRRVLGENGVRIVTHGRGYELQITDGVVDVLLAERLLDERRPRDALALWRGQPLADLAEEPFAAAEIRRLEELRLRATEMAVDADLEAGRHAAVIGELDALAASTRCVSTSTASGCSRSTAAAASRRRSGPTATRAPRSSGRSGSSRAPTSGGCTRASSPRIRRSTCLRRPTPSPLPRAGRRRAPGIC